MPGQVLNTVPRRVREIASSCESLEKLTGGRPEIGIRLVSYEEMRTTWASICGANVPDLPEMFFHFALELSPIWQKMPKVTDAVLRANIADIAATADNLAASIEAHKDEIHFHRGSRLTLDRVLVRAKSIRDGKDPAWDGWIPEAKDKFGDTYPGVAEFMRALAAELRPSQISTQAELRPTKVSDRNAERTYMVRSLSHFLKSVLDNPRFDLVANTVNTILDESDLDANHARKLASDLF